jgi:hypothetical protein
MTSLLGKAPLLKLQPFQKEIRLAGSPIHSPLTQDARGKTRLARKGINIRLGVRRRVLLNAGRRTRYLWFWIVEGGNGRMPVLHGSFLAISTSKVTGSTNRSPGSRPCSVSVSARSKAIRWSPRRRRIGTDVE